MKKTKLKDICNISAGGTPSRSNINYWNNGDIPWCKIGDFSGKYINQVKENITEEGLKNSSAKIFKRGTILYTIFATVGEVAILETESATNQAIAGLEIINNEVDLEYLYYYLKSLKFVMLKKSRGVAQNNINLGILKNIEIKIPSKIEQINIAKILDNIEKIIHKKKKQLKELNTIIKSQFVEMFDNKNYPKIRLKEVLVQDQNVEKIENTRKEKFVTVGINGKGARERIIKDEKWPVPFVGYRVKGGQFIYSRIDARNGAFAIIPNYLNNAVVSKDFPIFDIDYNKIKPDILLFSLLEESFIDIIKNSSFGATNRQRIKERTFLNYKIYLPPITLQNQFSEIVKQIDKQKFESMIQLEKENKDSINNIIKGTIEETTILYEVLLKKCFEKGKMN